MTSELHTPLTLADLIDNELIGIDPDSQRVLLDDTDWRLITTALRRTVPDAPELAIVGYTDIGTINLLLHGHVNKASIAPSAGGSFKEPVVLHSQAAAVIAAKDAEIERKQIEASKHAHDAETVRRERDALIAKLAQSEKQEAAGYFVKSGDKYIQLMHNEAAPSERVFPLYTAPFAIVADGIERAAKHIDGLVSEYAKENGSYDPETGQTEFSDEGLEYVSTLEELAEEIRALSAEGK